MGTLTTSVRGTQLPKKKWHRSAAHRVSTDDDATAIGVLQALGDEHVGQVCSAPVVEACPRGQQHHDRCIRRRAPGRATPPQPPPRLGRIPLTISAFRGAGPATQPARRRAQPVPLEHRPRRPEPVPPDSWVTGRSARPSRSAEVSASATRCRLGRRPMSAPPSAPISNSPRSARRSREGNRCWVITARRRASSTGARLRVAPSTDTVPLSAGTSPASTDSAVDLPTPFGPMIATNSPP